MTDTEKLHWLQDYLKNCLGEELSNVDGNYTFGYHKIADDDVLACECQVILEGRVIRTFNIQTFLDAAKDIEILTKESFAVMCTNNPILTDWYHWNLSRGMLSL